MSAEVFLEEELEERPVDTHILIPDDDDEVVEIVKDPLATTNVDEGGASDQSPSLAKDVDTEEVTTAKVILSCNTILGPSHTTASPQLGPAVATKLPAKIANLTIAKFTDTMRDSIHEIVYESLGWFQKDPREYHPFYLRIFKYVLIGQRLGYVSEEETHVINAIWKSFLQFAKTSYEESLHKPVTSSGERSPYAVYLQTKKVVVNGKVVEVVRDASKRNANLRNLETVAKKMRKEWEEKNPSGNIKDDTQAIFDFFKRCHSVTCPGDTLRMNNIWTTFLGGGDQPSQSEGPSITPTPSVLASLGPLSVDLLTASLPVTPPPLDIPPKYADMSFGEFTKEMHGSIQEVVLESLGLFQRDPREYFPFYLRIFKYVTIGQQLGFVSDEENTVISAIWGGFLKSAKAKYEAAVHKPVIYTGTKSPYATYLLTGKVIIDGKVVTKPTEDETVRKQQQLKELEGAAMCLRREWLHKNLYQADIKEDTRAIFNFFQICLRVTSAGFPGDTVEMNNIWSLFLSGTCSPPVNSGISQSTDSNEMLSETEIKKEDEHDSPPVKKLVIKVVVRPTPEEAPCSHTPPCSPCGSPIPSVGPSSPCPSPEVSLLGNGSFGKGCFIRKSKLKRRNTQALTAASKQPVNLKSLLQKKKRKKLLSLGGNPSGSSGGSHPRKLQQLKLEKLLFDSLKAKASNSNSPSVLSTLTRRRKTRSVIPEGPSTKHKLLTKGITGPLKAVKSGQKSPQKLKRTSKHDGLNDLPPSTVPIKCKEEAEQEKECPPPKKRLIKVIVPPTPKEADSNPPTPSSPLGSPPPSAEPSPPSSPCPASPCPSPAAPLEQIESIPAETVQKPSSASPNSSSQQEMSRQDPAGQPSCETRHARQLKTLRPGQKAFQKLKRSLVKKCKSKSGKTTALVGTRIGKCDFCPAFFNVKGNSMRHHVERVHPEKWGDWSMRTTALKKRLEYLRLTYSTLLFNCPVCKQQVILESLRHHLKSDHDIVEQWQCIACPKIFKERLSYFIHVGSLHRDTVSLKGVRHVARNLNNVPNGEDEEEGLTLVPRKVPVHPRSKTNPTSKKMHSGGARGPPEYRLCERCKGKTFCDVFNLWQHKVNDHGCSPENEAASLKIPLSYIQKCDLCPIWFCCRHTRKMSDHMEKEHPEKFKEWLLSSLNEKRKARQRVRGSRQKPPSPRPPSKEPTPAPEPQILEHPALIDPHGRKKCETCNKFFEPAHLPFHRWANHTKREKYKHAPRPRVKCPVCSEAFQDGAGQWSHFCSVHLKSRGLLHLDSCPPEYLPNESVLTTHRAPSTGEKLPPKVVFNGSSTCCEFCGKGPFCSPDSLRRHIYDLHGEGQRKENYHQCAFCPNTYKNVTILNEHLKRVHLELSKSKCPHCPRDLHAPGKLWTHMMEIHNVSAEEAADHCKLTIITCPFCSQVVLAGRQFAHHAKTNHPEQSPETIRKHQVPVKRHNKDGSVRPESESGRYSHQEGRSRDSGECPECGKELTAGMNRHRYLCHGVGDKKAYECPVEGCRSRLKQKTHLRRHLRTFHSQQMEERIVARKIIEVVEEGETYNVYRCILCPPEIAYMQYYDAIKTHVAALHPETFEEKTTEERVPPAVEFKCPHCGETGASEEEVRKHVKERHAAACGWCPECDRLVLDSRDLVKHFMEEHDKQREGGGTAAALAEKEPEKEGTIFLKLRPCNLGGYKFFPNKKCVKRGKRPEETGAGKQPKDRLEKVEQMARQKQLSRKYLELKSKCEICGRGMLMTRLYGHFRERHGILEDGEPFECNICTKKRRVYRPFLRRLYVYHMHMHHEKEVNMEAVVEEATKVRTKVHWSEMTAIKYEIVTDMKDDDNLEEPYSSEEEDSSSEGSDEESAYDSAATEKEEEFKRRGKAPESKLDRSSLQRKVAQAKNYKKLAAGDSSEEEYVGESKKKKTTGVDKRHNAGSTTTRPKRVLRTAGKKTYREVSSEAENDEEEGVEDNKRHASSSERGWTAVGKKKTTGIHSTTLRNGSREVEREKRLVILVERLRPEELERSLGTKKEGKQKKA